MHRSKRFDKIQMIRSVLIDQRSMAETGDRRQNATDQITPNFNNDDSKRLPSEPYLYAHMRRSACAIKGLARRLE